MSPTWSERSATRGRRLLLLFKAKRGPVRGRGSVPQRVNSADLDHPGRSAPAPGREPLRTSYLGPWATLDSLRQQGD